jgi:hypothetical protein
MTWSTPRSEKPLRQELLEARDSLVRQISILESGPSAPDLSRGYMQAQADELKSMLEQIEEELARTEADSP